MAIDGHPGAQLSRAGRLGPDPEPLGGRFEVLMRREFPPKRAVTSPSVAHSREVASWYLARRVEAATAHGGVGSAARR